MKRFGKKINFWKWNERLKVGVNGIFAQRSITVAIAFDVKSVIIIIMQKNIITLHNGPFILLNYYGSLSTIYIWWKYFANVSVGQRPIHKSIDNIHRTTDHLNIRIRLEILSYKNHKISISTRKNKFKNGIETFKITPKN